MTVTGEHVSEAADRLGVEPEPEAVADEVREWHGALYQITSKLDGEAAGIEPGDSVAERLLALQDAAVDGRLSVEPAGDDGLDTDARGGTDAARTGPRGESEDALGSTSPSDGGSEPDDDEPASPGAQAAARVADAREPSQRVIQQLLDTLQDGSVAGVELALERTADAVARSAAVGAIDDDSDPAAAREALADAREALADAPDPVATPFDERLSELSRQLEAAADGNPVVPYAVGREATFYAETFAGPLASLSVGDDGTDPGSVGDETAPGDAVASGDAAAPNDATAPGDATAPEDGTTTETIERVADRRREITELFVNRREDHSHAIPLLFLSTADDLRERAAEAADRGETARATGVAEAALALLDTVESLYEENQYSVMLRQLRGS